MVGNNEKTCWSDNHPSPKMMFVQVLSSNIASKKSIKNSSISFFLNKGFESIAPHM
jgi:hypothetical protein